MPGMCVKLSGTWHSRLADEVPLPGAETGIHRIVEPRSENTIDIVLLDPNSFYSHQADRLAMKNIWNSWAGQGKLSCDSSIDWRGVGALGYMRWCWVTGVV